MDGHTQSFLSMHWVPDVQLYSLNDFLNLPWGGILTLALISVFSMLLQASSLELFLDEELSLDYELKIASGANLITGALGGAVASLSLSQTMLNHQLGGEGKAPIVISALKHRYSPTASPQGTT